MPRRFQFSLKWLLALTAVACLTIGAWRLFVQHGQYVEIEPLQFEPLTTNLTLRVKGRFVVCSTAKEQPYWLGFEKDKEFAASLEGHAKRRLPFIYEADQLLGLPLEPGTYVAKGYPKARPFPAVAYTLILPHDE